jgi:carbon monoxide dehydrogenase subunit G
MNRFSATTASEAVVAADRSAVWAVLTDPELLSKLTPLVNRIDANGDIWCWHLGRIAALGVSVRPFFTERMRFEQERRIQYTHEPPRGTTERTGVDGCYELSDAPGGTRLAIGLTVHVDLPLAKIAGPAVTKVIKTTMGRTGDRFSANLLRELGID